MGKREAIRHLNTIVSGAEVNCATTSAATIVGELSEWAQECLFHSAFDLRQMGAVITAELIDRGVYAHIMLPHRGEKASAFFRRVAREGRFGGTFSFRGGLLLTKDTAPEHVLAVVKLHHRGKATIVNTDVHQENHGDVRDAVRKVPLSYLDRVVAGEDRMSIVFDRQATRFLAVMTVDVSELYRNDDGRASRWVENLRTACESFREESLALLARVKDERELAALN